MRKLLIALLLVIVTLSILWIAGSLYSVKFADEFIARQIESSSVQSIFYEGTGVSGILVINDRRLSLAPPTNAPSWWGEIHVGSTKENQLAIAYGGKVFVFGPLRSGDAQVLSADVPQSDTALLRKLQWYVPWPGFQNASFRLRRNNDYQLIWKKADSSSLEIDWQIDAEQKTPHLIDVEISDASR